MSTPPAELSAFDVIPRLAPIPTYLPAWQPHLLSGPSGVGKTAFTAYLVYRLAQGLPIFGRQVQRPPLIVLITTDREQDDTLEWYRIAGIDEIPCYSAVDDPTFNFWRLRNPIDALKKFEDILNTLKIVPNTLVITDPVSVWAGGDMNRYDRVMPAMGALSQLCLKRQFTLLGLAHTGKQKADPAATYKRAQDKILGSMALLGSSGTQMALEGPDQTLIDGEYRFTWNPHHAPTETFRLRRDEESGLFVPIEEEPATAPLMQPETELAAVVALLPPDTPLSSSDWCALALQQDISRPTFYRRVQRALDLGLIDKLGHGQYRRRVVN